MSKEQGLKLKKEIAELKDENIKLLDKLNLQNQRLNELKKENAELKLQVKCQYKNIKDCFKEIEQLKTELMHLKGCEQCKDRPKGELATVCPTEYEQHCIGQKMTHIKELEEENEALKKQCSNYEMLLKRFVKEEELSYMECEPKSRLELLEEIDELKKDKEWLENTDNEQTEVILNLQDQIEKMKCCGNCRHQKYDYESKYCEYDATRKKECNNYSQWELAE